MNFDFIGRKKYWFALSSILVTLGLIGIFGVGLDYGIEFKGGTSIEAHFDRDVNVEEMRSFLESKGHRESIIQPIGKNQLLIRVDQLDNKEEVKLSNEIGKEFNVDPKDDLAVHTVGPAWGQFITDQAILAFVISILALLVYISVRFEYKMAIAVIIALFHDLIITFGIYALVRRQVTPNTIAAILTILGYSLYDTIVVFHRIKENEPTVVRQTFSQMVNVSVNQVLMRSINTSLVTILPISALLFLGGDTLKDFAFALLVGMAAGAYSSIFLASPLFAMWKEREPRYVAVRNRVAQSLTHAGEHIEEDAAITKTTLKKNKKL